jgi:hypothetical protein
VAGCGSSSSSSSSGGGTTSSTPSTTTSGGSTTTSGGSTTTSSSGGGSANPQVAAAVAACKNAINSAPTLDAADKSKLSDACDKAANGDLAGVKKVAEQVCNDVVKKTVPAAGQAQAQAACKSIGG